MPLCRIWERSRGLFFTSYNAVVQTFERLHTQGLDSRALGNAKVAAIGEKTAQTLQTFGIRADFVPQSFVSEAALQEFTEPVKGCRVLFPRALEGRDVLPDGLRERGAMVDVVPAYQTVPDTENAGEIHTQLASGI